MTITYDPKLHKIVPIEPTQEMLDHGYRMDCIPVDKLLRAYQSMLSSAPEITLNQWQDISTAPKDGVYDVIVENKYRLTDIKFKDGEWLDRVLDFDNDFSHYEKVENVTHWMPRPTAPTPPVSTTPNKSTI